MHRAKASRHVFLFDRMVLITKRREDATLAYKAHIMVKRGGGSGVKPGQKDQRWSQLAETGWGQDLVKLNGVKLWKDFVVAI